jgi:hypothetical protein
MPSAWARKRNSRYVFRAHALVAVSLAVSFIGGACSGGGGSAATTVATTSSVASGQWPRVDLIDDAITALETKLGGGQQYFEINATAKLVNLFVALNDGKIAQPWVYLDGELSSSDGQPASGFTFEKGAVDFDPDAVLTQVEAQLAQSRPDVFFIEAGAGGVVRYSVAVTSPQGGQLVAVVAGDGKVLSVET